MDKGDFMAVMLDERVKAVTCPRCGFAFNANDPRVLSLPPSTRSFWTTPDLERFRQGQSFALSEIARRVHMTHPAAYYHLRRLRDAGLVDVTPKREGGTYNLYHGHKC
jgi:DNA-binding transcriptional ArsR family regulator